MFSHDKCKFWGSTIHCVSSTFSQAFKRSQKLSIPSGWIKRCLVLSWSNRLLRSRGLRCFERHDCTVVSLLWIKKRKWHFYCQNVNRPFFHSKNEKMVTCNHDGMIHMEIQGHAALLCDLWTNTRHRWLWKYSWARLLQSLPVFDLSDHCSCCSQALDATIHGFITTYFIEIIHLAANIVVKQENNTF